MIEFCILYDFYKKVLKYCNIAILSWILKVLQNAILQYFFNQVLQKVLQYFLKVLTEGLLNKTLGFFAKINQSRNCNLPDRQSILLKSIAIVFAILGWKSIAILHFAILLEFKKVLKYCNTSILFLTITYFE